VKPLLLRIIRREARQASAHYSYESNLENAQAGSQTPPADVQTKE
jgi:hypothetical protein